MSKTKTLIYCSLFTALIAAGAFIKIPVPVVPFTLQYLFTMLAGLLLGSKRGTISVVATCFWGLQGFRSSLRAAVSGMSLSRVLAISLDSASELT